jgi:hypothetical protein
MGPRTARNLISLLIVVLAISLTLVSSGCASYSTITLKRCETQFQCFEVSYKSRIDEIEAPNVILEKTGPDSYRFGFNAESTANTASPMEIAMAEVFVNFMEGLPAMLLQASGVPQVPE